MVSKTLNSMNRVIKYDKNGLEAPGIDPGTSRMLSERSTI